MVQYAPDGCTALKMRSPVRSAFLKHESVKHDYSRFVKNRPHLQRIDCVFRNELDLCIESTLVRQYVVAL
jgi:hypothetical protein